MSKIEKIFTAQWDEIKGKLKSHWGKLTDNDIKQIDGSFEELAAKLKKHYNLEAANLEKEVADFFSENDIEGLKEQAKSLKDETFDKVHDMEKMVKECVGDYYQKMKESTAQVEESFINYCKTNPLKTAGMFLIAGFAFGALMTKKGNN